VVGLLKRVFGKGFDGDEATSLYEKVMMLEAGIPFSIKV